jgi:uncharacterized membrane protein
MNMWIAAAVVLAILVVTLLASRTPMHRRGVRVSMPSSPLDHAEKILASRYARHEISAEEYGRMLVVLRK